MTTGETFGLFDHFVREDVRQIVFVDHDLNVHSGASLEAPSRSMIRPAGCGAQRDNS